MSVGFSNENRFVVLFFLAKTYWGWLQHSLQRNEQCLSCPGHPARVGVNGDAFYDALMYDGTGGHNSPYFCVVPSSFGKKCFATWFWNHHSWVWVSLNTIDSNEYGKGDCETNSRIENSIYCLVVSTILGFFVSSWEIDLHFWELFLTTMSQPLLPKCSPTKSCIPQKCQACQMDTRLFGQQLNGSFFSPLGQKKGRPWWLVNAFDHCSRMWFHQLLFTLRKYVGQEFTKKTHGEKKHDIWVAECRVDSSSHYWR